MNGWACWHAATILGCLMEGRHVADMVRQQHACASDGSVPLFDHLDEILWLISPLPVTAEGQVAEGPHLLPAPRSASSWCVQAQLNAQLASMNMGMGMGVDPASLGMAPLMDPSHHAHAVDSPVSPCWHSQHLVADKPFCLCTCAGPGHHLTRLTPSSAEASPVAASVQHG